MTVDDPQLVDEILVLDPGGRLAGAAAALGLVVRQGLGLGVAAVGDRDHPILLGNEVFHGQVVLRGGDLGETIVAVFRDNLLQLFPNHQLEAIRVRQDLTRSTELSRPAAIAAAASVAVSV